MPYRLEAAGRSWRLVRACTRVEDVADDSGSDRWVGCSSKTGVGKGVTVAVIDTGIYYDESGLAGSIASGGRYTVTRPKKGHNPNSSTTQHPGRPFPGRCLSQG